MAFENFHQIKSGEIYKLDSTEKQKENNHIFRYDNLKEPGYENDCYLIRKLNFNWYKR